jgi:PAS domain S-box-containing protein
MATDGASADALRARIWQLAADPSLSEDEVIQRLLDEVGPALGVARASFHRLTPEGITCALSWHASGFPSGVGVEFPAVLVCGLVDQGAREVTRETLAAHAAASGDRDNHRDADRDAAAAALDRVVRELRTPATYAVPCTVAGRLIGVFTFDQGAIPPPGWSEPHRPVIADVVRIVNQTITSRRAAAMLRESEQRYRELAHHLPALLFETDAQGRLTFLNRYALDVLGLTEEDVAAGRHLFDVVAPEDRERTAARLKGVLAGGASIGTEYKLASTAHGTIDVLAHGIRIVKDGVLQGMLGVAVDLTAQRQAEAERLRLETKLQQAQKLESLGLLAGGIAHDFNNLLVSVLGNAELGLHAAASSPTEIRLFERIKRAAQRAAELANQMLAYSGKGRRRIERVDLSTVVAEMTEFARSAVPRKGVLTFACARDLPPVEVDVTQLRQVVMNLILNAAEAIADGPGTITVSTGRCEEDVAALAAAYADYLVEPGPFVYLEVADTGCGMEAELQARIFEPFFTTKLAGRGLGLAAVLGIVRSHRGAIKLRSAPGEGTSFRVLLRPAAEAAVAPEPPAMRGEWRGAGVVLVVDDEADVREVSSDMLGMLGFEVLAAADGHAALELVQRRAAHLLAVLLDVTMPGMSGEEVFDRIRDIAPRLPIIVTSGYGEDDLSRRFDARRPAAVLQKPFVLDTLADRLRAVLAAQELRTPDGPPGS